jgi:microcystin-dependent protein
MATVEERLERRLSGFEAQLTTLTTALAEAQRRLQQAEREAVPVGTIENYGGRYSQGLLDGGWLPCDGRPLSGNEYPELFASIGKLWGRGNGGERDFNLPPSGLFLRGATMDPARADLEGRTPLGDGAPTEVGSFQDDATRLPRKGFKTDTHPGHYHHDPTFNGQGGNTYELATTDRAVGGYDYGAESAPTSTNGEHHHQIIEGGDAETRPKNVYVTHIIKAGRQVDIN